MSTLPSLISSLCCSTSPMLNLQHDAPSHTPARTGIRCRFQSCIHLLHKTVSLHLESASSTDQNWADPAPASKRWTWRALNRGSGARVWLGCVPGALTPTPGLVPLLWLPGLLLVLSLKRGCHGWPGLRLIPGCVPKSWSGRLCGLPTKSWFCRMTLVRLLFFGSAAKSWPLPQLRSPQQVLVPTGSVV